MNNRIIKKIGSLALALALFFSSPLCAFASTSYHYLCSDFNGTGGTTSCASNIFTWTGAGQFYSANTGPYPAVTGTVYYISFTITSGSTSGVTFSLYNHGGTGTFTSSQVDAPLSITTSGGDTQLYLQDFSGDSFSISNVCISDTVGVCRPSLTVTTNSAESFTPDTATLFGSVTGGGTATTCGFAWGTNSALSGGDTATTTDSTCPGTTGSFSRALSSLSANTTYYFKAYATNTNGTGYGSILNFTTGNTTPTRHMRLFEGFKIKFVSGKMIINQQ